MPLADPGLPYGLRDIKLRPIDGAGVVGASVDLPVARKLTFKETEESVELRGDDTVVAVHGNGAFVEWEIEAGGISLDAYAVMSGGTVTESGTGTTEVKEYTRLGSESRPYFQIEAKSVEDAGGDVHVIIYKTKADGSLEGEFGDGQFFITKCSGKGITDGDDNLYTITWNETAEDIA